MKESQFYTCAYENTGIIIKHIIKQRAGIAQSVRLLWTGQLGFSL